MDDDTGRRERERAELLVGTPELSAERTRPRRRRASTLGAGLLAMLIGVGVLAWVWQRLVEGFEDAPTTRPPGVSETCAELNATYPHGVSRGGTRDEPESGHPQVLTYAVRPEVYARHAFLDTDRDGIACER